jgi:hypothetical protein
MTALVAVFLIGCLIGLLVGHWLATRPVTEETVWDDFNRLPLTTRRRLCWIWGEHLNARK